MYIKLNADGIYTIYDYAGDSFDNVSNCYWHDSGKLTDLGNGVFRDDYDNSTCSMKVCSGNLMITCDGESSAYSSTTKSDLRQFVNRVEPTGPL